jgi:DNA-binding transcriptional MerR regulator/effector-binding domain-containing protein
MLRIGTFARLGGTSAKALRDYDTLGLFRPAWVDPATGYRAYSPAQLPELRRILALRGMGVGLAEIGRLVSGGADLAAVLDRRRAELELERREIERRLAALDIHLETAGSADNLDVVVRPVAAEPVATLALGASGGDDVEAAFYELEVHVRDHGRRARRPPGTLVHAGAADGRRIVEVFVPVRGTLVPTERIGYRRLPAARMATIIHHGPYGALPATRTALERWVSAAGLAATGPLRILYLQFGAETELRLPRDYLVNRDADFVTELQLPVG